MRPPSTLHGHPGPNLAQPSHFSEAGFCAYTSVRGVFRGVSGCGVCSPVEFFSVICVGRGLTQTRDCPGRVSPRILGTSAHPARQSRIHVGVRGWCRRMAAWQEALERRPCGFCLALLWTGKIALPFVSHVSFFPNVNHICTATLGGSAAQGIPIIHRAIPSPARLWLRGAIASSKMLVGL